MAPHPDEYPGGCRCRSCAARRAHETRRRREREQRARMERGAGFLYTISGPGARATYVGSWSAPALPAPGLAPEPSPLWRTREGREVPVREMDDRHVWHALRLLMQRPFGGGAPARMAMLRAELARRDVPPPSSAESRWHEEYRRTPMRDLPDGTVIPIGLNTLSWARAPPPADAPPDATPPVLRLGGTRELELPQEPEKKGGGDDW